MSGTAIMPCSSPCPKLVKQTACSFCGKGKGDVAKLIHGPTVAICDECVELCNDIVMDETSASDAAEREVLWELPPVSQLVLRDGSQLLIRHSVTRAAGLLDTSESRFVILRLFDGRPLAIAPRQVERIVGIAPGGSASRRA